MASPRSEQVDLSVTRYYHCMSRCVRRAFLCGEDAYSGQNYSHRKAWVRDRLRHLASVFAIDICAYAVMENHLHVVLAVDVERAASWPEEEIVARYTKLYPMAQVSYDAAAVLGEVNPLLQTWRTRLSDLSWMMRALNEYIARKANKEEKAHGRFWEGRFKSQALVDEKGLLTCMAYVDLNPVRSGTVDTLEASSFTSIQDRLAEIAEGIAAKRCPKHLAPMEGEASADKRIGNIPLGIKDYVALLRWTGSALAKGKRGKLAATEATKSGVARNLLQNQGIDPDGFLHALSEHRVGTVRFLGSESTIEELTADLNKQWLRGIGLARTLAPAH